MGGFVRKSTNTNIRKLKIQQLEPQVKVELQVTGLCFDHSGLANSHLSVAVHKIAQLKYQFLIQIGLYSIRNKYCSRHFIFNYFTII